MRKIKANNYFCNNALWFDKINILDYVSVDGDIQTKLFMEYLLMRATQWTHNIWL